MENKDIHELIKLISKTNLAEFKLRDGEFELTIRTDAYTRARLEVPAQVIAQPSPMMMPAPAPASLPPTPAPAAPETSASASDVKSSKPAEAAPSNLLEVKSPMVGTFYRSPSPDKPIFVQVGDHVKAGDVVCIIEAMKLFNEIESEVSGKVVKVMVDDANPVEYDQVLFLVDPAG
jgi:acetyl-CoA carboxylase biotin carboxyl carrier protein